MFDAVVKMFRFLATAAGLLLVVVPAQADGECPVVRMGEEGKRKGKELAALTRTYLQESDARVALLGRAGSSAPQERFAARIGFWNYTHGGLVYRDHPDGEWLAVHLINTCGTKSQVMVHSLEEFFMDNPYEYRTVAAIPSLPMQAALASLVLEQDAARGFLNNNVYSSISWPFSLETQNSNEYVLDLFAAALAAMEEKPILSREHAKEYFLSSEHRDKYTPELVRVGFIEAFGASIGLGPDNATLEDHTAAERAAGEYQFVSVGSLIQFLQNLDMLEAAEEFALPDISKATDTIIEE